MKRFLKRSLKPIWRATGPIRRPIRSRAEAFLRSCLTIPPAPTDATDEIVVVLDHVVRELVRLQDDVDRLRAAVEDRPGGTLPMRGEARRAG